MKKNKNSKKISVLLLFALISFQLSPILSLNTYAEGEENIENTNTVETTVTDESTSTENTIIESISPVTADATTSPVVEIIHDVLISTTTEAASTPVGASTTDEAVILETTEFISTGTSTATSTNIILDSATETSATSTLPTGTTTIQTGDAVALSNITNIVNTNLVNSTGTIVLENLVNGTNQDIDFRNLNLVATISSSTTICTLLSCNGISSTTVNTNTEAGISNDINLQAVSGTNTISTVQSAVINTGDTLAGLNLVNIANTNFVDSNYLLISLNSFNSVNGDIILPSISNLFSDSNSDNNLVLNNLNISSSASFENNLQINANTGKNNILQSQNGITNSGSSESATNIYNNTNSFLVGGNSISVLLKVSGNWIGELFGLPNGNIFIQDGNALTLNYDDSFNNSKNSNANSLDLNSTSTAQILNNVNVGADSGNNQILDTENATINTGHSLAAANIVNIANSNIIGKNWILAIINIFGDFNGNISFGRPDLWIGEQVSSTAQIQNDSVLNYKITIINNGDSEGGQLKVSSAYDDEHLDILTSSIPYTENNSGNLEFNIPNLNPKESAEITFQAKIKNTVPGTAISNSSTITVHEKDNNFADNTDTTTITTSQPQNTNSGGGGSGNNNNQQIITIIPISNLITNQIDGNNSNEVSINQNTKENQNNNLTANVSVVRSQVGNSQKLVITNLNNQKIANASFIDIIYDTNNSELKREIWDIGEMLEKEEITLSYDVEFSKSSASGIYNFSSEFNYLENEAPKTLYFKQNGFLTYTNTNPEVQPLATMQTTEPIPVHNEFITKPNIYNLFSPQKAEASEIFPTPVSVNSQENLYYIFLSMFLFLTSSMYLFIKKNL